MARNTNKTEVEVTMTEREAVAAIAVLCKEAYAAIRKAEALANKFEVDFSFDVAYGMGGTYVSEKKAPKGEDEDDWESSDEAGWQSSSSNC